MKKNLILIVVIVIILPVMFVVGAFLNAWNTPHTLVVSTLYPLAADQWSLNGKLLAVGRGFCVVNKNENWSVQLVRANGDKGSVMVKPEFSFQNSFPFLQLKTTAPAGFNLGISVADVAVNPQLKEQFSCPK
jgi:hypothetical protein